MTMITEGGVLSDPRQYVGMGLDMSTLPTAMRRADYEEFTAIADALLRTRWGHFARIDAAGVVVDKYGIAALAEGGPADPLWLRR
jgi:hypothetical protein